jgi:hypothetical protein
MRRIEARIEARDELYETSHLEFTIPNGGRPGTYVPHGHTLISITK